MLCKKAMKAIEAIRAVKKTKRQVPKTIGVIAENAA